MEPHHKYDHDISLTSRLLLIGIDGNKNRLMTYRTLFHRIIILGFMVLVGYCIANAIRSESFMGLLLALTSLGAGIYFMHLLNQRSIVSENETRETS